jgi:diacylglycerol kinase (ATP)
MKRLFLAFLYSISGLKVAFQDEAAFRQEIAMTFILIPCAFLLAQTKIECVGMVGSVLLILITELINTAIEATVDRLGKELHPLSKKAKDVGSAAVFLALLNLLFVWGIILLRP